MTSVYEVSYKFGGVNYTKKCTAYDIDTSMPGCLTMYFGDNKGRIIVPMDRISNFHVVCIWRI